MLPQGHGSLSIPDPSSNHSSPQSMKRCVFDLQPIGAEAGEILAQTIGIVRRGFAPDRARRHEFTPDLFFISFAAWMLIDCAQLWHPPCTWRPRSLATTRLGQVEILSLPPGKPSRKNGGRMPDRGLTSSSRYLWLRRLKRWC